MISFDLLVRLSCFWKRNIVFADNGQPTQQKKKKLIEQNFCDDSNDQYMLNDF